MARSRRHPVVRLLCFLAFSILFPQLNWSGTPEDKASLGVIVEEVGKGAVAERAGLQPGDVIMSWSRVATWPANPNPARGRIGSPFDLMQVEVEQAPRGALTLTGKRGPKTMAWAIGPGKWGLEARPNMSPGILRFYLEGKNFADAKNAADASHRWQQAADAARRSDRNATATWILFRIARLDSSGDNPEQAIAAFEAAIRNAEQYASSAITARLLMSLGQTLQDRKLWDRAEEIYKRALGLRERREQESLEVAETLNALSAVARNRNKMADGEELARRASAICQKLAPESFPTAEAYGNLGNFQLARRDFAAAGDNFQLALSMVEKVDPQSSREVAILNGMSRVAFGRNDLGKAQDYAQQAITIAQKLDPESLMTAQMLSNAAEIAWRHGDLQKAEAYDRQVVVIREKKIPQSRGFAGSLVNLANILFDKGDPAGAEQLYTQALELSQSLEPEGEQAANILSGLGNVCWGRGDLARADDYYRHALSIDEKLFGPGGQRVGMVLQNLGNVASDRGDYAAAEAYNRRALAIVEKFEPGSLEMAGTLDNLGNVAIVQGNLEEAESFQKRALEIYEKQAPESLDAARNLNNLGVVADKRRKLEESKQFHQRALAIEAKSSPGSVELAHTLSFLAKRFDEVHDFTSTQKYFLDALAIQSKLAPGSTDEAEALHGLGVALRREGKSTDAAKYLCQAVDSLEGQKAKLGGSEEQRSGFVAQNADYYVDCSDALVDLNRIADAFHVLERSRARSLLAMMAERDLALSADVPAQFLKERKAADADYDDTQSAVGKLSTAKDPEEIERLLQHLREVRNKQEEIADRIRKASPRFASLNYPQPLDVSGARAALDSGTVLLSYSVGEKKTTLFVLQGTSGTPVLAEKATGLSVFSLPRGKEGLREKVGALRNLIERHREADKSELQKQAAELYDILMKPAEALLATCDRLLISPDGPLHTLPFAALVRMPTRGKKAGPPQYLIEWKPVHTIVSATVYAELKKSRRTPGAAEEIRVTAFGDPKYPTRANEKPEQIANTELRFAVTRGFSLAPLPSTRIEVESIAGLFPSSTVKYIGEQATEERAKSVGKDVRYLHFAVHGLLDEQFPLNSALALTIPENPGAGQDNGLLQAWEIFEQMRIDADLVTLSACETALGKEMGGEGLVGLARAFQYAGARSVVASLWSVSDESTAELMKRFYGYLKAGKTKDDALRLAQIDLIQAGTKLNHSSRGAAATNAHPFHWAAFELIGDWK